MYGKKLVADTKVLLNVLVLYIPLPVFWSLYDQQGSRWTFQATRMNGDIGFYEIKPDQMQVVNPLLILLFIPTYEVLFYPLLSKIGIRRPLQKLSLGGVLAGVAFLCSGFVELKLEETYPVLAKAGESQMRLFNTLPCEYTAATNIPDHGSFIIKSMEKFQQTIALESAADQQSFTYTLQPNSVNAACPTLTGTLVLRSAEENSFYIRQQSLVSFVDAPQKSRNGEPLARVLTNSITNRRVRIVDAEHPTRLVRFDGTSDTIDLVELVASTFEIVVDDQEVGTIELNLGSVTTLIIMENPAGQYTFGSVVVTEANSVHMLWLLPQYIIMTLGEVMFSITGLAFSYSQAPVSMKAVLQACWLLAVAFGNVIDIIIVGARAFESQSAEFFLFAGLLFVDMLLFMYLAYRYKTVESIPEEAEQLMAGDGSADAASIEYTRKTSKDASGLDNVAFKPDKDNK